MLTFLVVFGFSWVSAVHSQRCPGSNGTLRRLGGTGYYIIHGSTRDGFVTQPEAYQQCQERGMSLATFSYIADFAQIGRQLEILNQKERYKDTWYWLDAKFDNETGLYYWKGEIEPWNVVFANYLFRPPRPVGIGKHISYKGIYQKEESFEQCLAIALPWPNPKQNGSGDPKSEIIYGSQVSLDERHCLSQKSRHAICQSDCSVGRLGPPHIFSFLTEFANHWYFKGGYFIFGDRKYLVKYNRLDFALAKENCEDDGLQLFIPGKDERYLIPHLKLWARGLTQSQFWTDLKYNARTGEFITPDGTVVANQTYCINWTDSDLLLAKRSTAEDEMFCVAMSFSYEFKSQMPCSDFLNPLCTWSFIKYVPANCKNEHGYICQHKDHAQRSIEWKKINVNDLSPILKDDLLTPYGYKGNTRILRSKVKQQFGACYCPKGYQMMTIDTTFRNPSFTELDIAWRYEPIGINETDLYKYDYSQDYWLVDKHGLSKNATTQCSWLESYSLRKYSCYAYNFYLCEKHRRPTKIRQQFNQTWTKVKSEWRDGVQSRFYPTVVNNSFYNLTRENNYGKVEGLTENCMIVLHGQFLQNTTRVYIDLVVAKDLDNADLNDIALRLDIHFTKFVTMNTRIADVWGKEQKNGTFPFRKEYTFKLEFECLHDRFMIYVDSKYFNTYKYRIDLESINYVYQYGGMQLIKTYFYQI